jgi:nucleotide-binding universal stress UspA family protein
MHVTSALPTLIRMVHVKILVAYDGGLAARRALYKAAHLARVTNAAVGVVSVVPVHQERGRSTIVPWDDQNRHRDDLEEADAIFKANGIEPELIEVVGNPAQRIDEVAQAGGYDTIVLGARRKGWLDRLLTGSVMRDVLERVSAAETATVVVVP